MGHPSRIETSVSIASMRMIHAAIAHYERGDYECSIVLASAGEGILPPTEKPYFLQKVQALEASIQEAREKGDVEVSGAAEANAFSNWLKHGKHDGKRKDGCIVETLEAQVMLYRAITKFMAVYEDNETPQMTYFLRDLKQALLQER